MRPESPTGEAENGPQQLRFSRILLSAYQIFHHLRKEWAFARNRMEIRMRIPLRSPDTVRRMAERFDRRARHWPHNKRLLALAAMYGYPSWEALVASCTPDAPAISYDQDLPSDSARQERWLAMAQQVSAALGMLLPEAIHLVNSIVPTMRMGVEMPLWYEPNDVFDRALCEDRDVWWVCASHHGHPLVPPGFTFSRAVRCADVASRRLARQHGLDPSYDELCVLAPIEIERQTNHPHYFCRRKDLVVIEPIPFADALASPKTMARHLHTFFYEGYPSWFEEQRQQRLAEWLEAIKRLKLAAGLQPTSRKRWIQFTVSTRHAIGHEWYWPLRIIDTSQEALSKAAVESARVDRLLADEFGTDPGYVQAG